MTMLQTNMEHCFIYIYSHIKLNCCLVVEINNNTNNIENNYGNGNTRNNVHVFQVIVDHVYEILKC